MPTEKPRVTITMSNEQFKSIDNYRYAHKMKNQTQAILSLIEHGLSKLEQDAPTHNKKNAPFLPNEALEIAKDYNSLDSHGKAAVRGLMDEELNRMEELANLSVFDPEKEPRVINLFLEPSAAGIAAPVAGQDYEAYTLTDNDPHGAAFAVRIQGDSMEPYFPDGSTVFVNHDALADGDIGIFCVDGGTVCKQYHKQGGVVYLFSLNRQRQDADVVISPDSNRSFVCQGRVMTKRHFPVPEM